MKKKILICLFGFLILILGFGITYSLYAIIKVIPTYRGVVEMGEKLVPVYHKVIIAEYQKEVLEAYNSQRNFEKKVFVSFSFLTWYSLFVTTLSIVLLSRVVRKKVPSES